MTAPATHGAATSAARRLPLPGFVDGTLLTLVAAAVILWFAPSGMGRYGTYVLSLWLVMSVAVMGLNLTLGYAGLKSLAQAAFMGIGAYATALLTSKVGLNWYASFAISGLITFAVGAWRQCRRARRRRPRSDGNAPRSRPRVPRLPASSELPNARWGSRSARAAPACSSWR